MHFIFSRAVFTAKLSGRSEISYITPTPTLNTKAARWHGGCPGPTSGGQSPLRGVEMLSTRALSAHCSATQLCPTEVCYCMGFSPPGSSVPGILQARALERLPCPPPGDLPDPGTFCLLHWQVGSSPLAPPSIVLKVKVVQPCLSLPSHGLYSPWISPGQNTGMGSLSLLHGIFPTQGLNPGLLHCSWILYQLSHKEIPRILE